jgi:hypothetical protein
MSKHSFATTMHVASNCRAAAQDHLGRSQSRAHVTSAAAPTTISLVPHQLRGRRDPKRRARARRRTRSVSPLGGAPRAMSADLAGNLPTRRRATNLHHCKTANARK